jgi:hypothetical protein
LRRGFAGDCACAAGQTVLDFNGWTGRAAGSQTVMYKKILVALENSRADNALLPHVAELAGHFHSQLALPPVADGGWRAISNG